MISTTTSGTSYRYCSYCGRSCSCSTYYTDSSYSSVTYLKSREKEYIKFLNRMKEKFLIFLDSKRENIFRMSVVILSTQVHGILRSIYYNRALISLSGFVAVKGRRLKGK